MNDPILVQAGLVQLTLSQVRYATYMIVGVSLLWPWNCFLSASAYYAERFAHTPSLIRLLLSTIMTVSSVFSTIFNAYLSQSQKGVNYLHRVYQGLSLTIVVFFIMAISCVSDFFIHMNDYLFFFTLIGMVFVSALATCFAQNGTMALVNVAGSIYANGVMVGQAVAGVLPSIALIVSILLVGEVIHSNSEYMEKDYGVFLYYITASLLSAASMGLLWFIHQDHTQGYEALGQTYPTFEEEVQKEHVPFLQLWNKLKLIVMTIFLTFSITLVFPVFASNIASTHTESHRLLFQNKIFVPIAFLMWNLGDLLGRIFCGKFPRFIVRKSHYLIWYSVGRLLFIPLFLTCNIHPNSSKGQSSALVNSDIWYLTLQFLFGLSNGQLSTSCFMVVGDFCDTTQEKEAAGGFTTVFLSSGLAFGSVLSYLLVFFID